MQRTPADFLLRNGSAEQSHNPWSTLGTATITTTRSTTSPFAGTYSWQGLSSPAGQTVYVGQSLANPTVYQSRSITVGGYVALIDAAGSGFTPRIEIYDGVGTTSSSTVSSSSFTYVSATRTIDAAATEVTIRVGNSSQSLTGTNVTYRWDDLFVIPAGGTTWQGTAEYAGVQYGAFGRVVCQWNETDLVWRAVYVHASANATAIVHFANNVFVAFGTTVDYIYGSGTTWTVSTLGTKQFQFFAVARNAAGTYALWGNAAANTVQSNTAGTNGGAAWSSAYTIGSSDRTITRLFGVFDTLVIGKEDGLWMYSRYFANTASAEDVFHNIAPDWDVAVHADNFALGIPWHGWLWMTAAQQAFLRWAPGEFFDDLTALFIQPRYTRFGGRIRAMAGAPHEMFLLIDSPENADGAAFPITFPATLTGANKTIMLASMREKADALRVHTLDLVSIGVIDALSVFSGYVYALGAATDTNLDGRISSAYRWALPTYTPAPYNDLTPLLELSGTFDTCIWHGGNPDTQKAFLALTIWCNNLSSTRTVAVAYGLDGAVPTTTTLGTYSGTGRIQTLYFQGVSSPITNAVGRAIQMRLTFTTDDAAESPQVFAFALHSTLRPERVRAWEIFVLVGPEIPQETGFSDPTSKDTQLTRLNTLETQTYPIVLAHDFDTETHSPGAPAGALTTVTVHMLARERVGLTREGHEIHRLILQEADTSA